MKLSTRSTVYEAPVTSTVHLGMMDQFQLVKFIYTGYTVFTLILVDDEGYKEWEKTIGHEYNNIRSNQNFRYKELLS